MLEPADTLSKQCDVMIARVVCRVERGRLPIRVINVTKDALTLKEGMRLGTLHTDIEVGCKAEHLGMGEDEEGPKGTWSVDKLIAYYGLQQKNFTPSDVTDIRDLLRRNMSVFSECFLMQ